jgi:hypothetical protein
VVLKKSGFRIDWDNDVVENGWFCEKKYHFGPFKQLPFLSRKGHEIKCLGLENISCSLLLRSRFEWEKSHLIPLIHGRGGAGMDMGQYF